MNINEALEEQWRIAHSEHCTNMQNCSSFGGDKTCNHPRPAVEGYSIFSHAQNGPVVIEESTPISSDTKRVRSPRGLAVEAGLGLGPQFDKTRSNSSTNAKPRVKIDAATVDRMAQMIDNLARQRDLIDEEIKTWMLAQGADPKDGWRLVLPATRQYDLGELGRLKYVIFSRTIDKPVLVKRNDRG